MKYSRGNLLFYIFAGKNYEDISIVIHGFPFSDCCEQHVSPGILCHLRHCHG